jgi:hypothetical protein
VSEMAGRLPALTCSKTDTGRTGRTGQAGRTGLMGISKTEMF